MRITPKSENIPKDWLPLIALVYTLNKTRSKVAVAKQIIIVVMPMRT
jgi:hypothetical protein